jgi:hypothetical protein
VARTQTSRGLQFNIALNYGGRAEIVDAAKRLFADLLRDGRDPETIDEAAIAERLYTAGQPDPDLLIRTSGEQRISNFLLWQIAYSEIWVSDVLWPDFRRRHLLQAIVDYQKRERATAASPGLISLPVPQPSARPRHGVPRAGSREPRPARPRPRPRDLAITVFFGPLGDGRPHDLRPGRGLRCFGLLRATSVRCIVSAFVPPSPLPR